MFLTTCQGQNDRIERAVIWCFCQNLQFRLNFAIKTSIFKLRPLLRFLCLINSFYRRYVSSMYNRSNRSNRLTRFNKLILAEGQQLKKQLLHREFLSVARAWFSWSGKQEGAYSLTAFNDYTGALCKFQMIRQNSQKTRCNTQAGIHAFAETFCPYSEFLRVPVLCGFHMLLLMSSCW